MDIIQRSETLDQKYERIPICMKYRSAWRKPTKAGMTLADFAKEKCMSTEPTRLTFTTGVVCHPDTKQNKLTKSPGLAGNCTRDQW